MAKPASIQIKLVSTADTGFYYVTKKNPRNHPEKMEFKKYDPKAKKHVIFKEAKIKDSKICLYLVNPTFKGKRNFIFKKFNCIEGKLKRESKNMVVNYSCNKRW